MIHSLFIRIENKSNGNETISPYEVVRSILEMKLQDLKEDKKLITSNGFHSRVLWE